MGDDELRRIRRRVEDALRELHDYERRQEQARVEEQSPEQRRRQFRVIRGGAASAAVAGAASALVVLALVVPMDRQIAREGQAVPPVAPVETVETVPPPVEVDLDTPEPGDEQIDLRSSERDDESEPAGRRAPVADPPVPEVEQPPPGEAELEPE